jgi:hypothetical protein
VGFAPAGKSVSCLDTFKEQISKAKMDGYESVSFLIYAFGNENICTDDGKNPVRCTTFFASWNAPH